MEKEGLLLIAQVDHLTGEEVGWALQVLSIPGVRNRNLIPTLTKKGRTGYMLMVDVDAEAEADVARLLLESFGTYGYHRILTRHVHQEVEIKEMTIMVHHDEKSIKESVRMKRLVDHGSTLCFLETDDLFSLQGRIRKELGVTLSPRDLRRRIEAMGENGRTEAAELTL